MKKPFYFPLLVIGLAFATSGCAIQFTGTKSGAAGIQQSVDLGITWSQKNFIGQEGKKIYTISGLNVNKIIPDGILDGRIFITTDNDGIYVTDDYAETWRRFFGKATHAYDIARQPLTDRSYYSSIGNALYKTVDDGETWEIIYKETTPGAIITVIATDNYNPKRMFIATSLGTINVSEDNGETWKLALTVTDKYINRLIVANKDTRYLYATTTTAGLHRSADGGNTWEDMRSGLKPFKGAEKMYDLIVNSANKNELYAITAYGILRSKNAGDTWDAYTLLTKPGAVRIQSFAINPNNTDEIFYTVRGTFYRTYDGGVTWGSSPLPVPHDPTAMRYVGGDVPIIYLGYTIYDDPNKGFLR